jgi:hypothetical protein
MWRGTSHTQRLSFHSRPADGNQLVDWEGSAGQGSQMVVTRWRSPACYVEMAGKAEEGSIKWNESPMYALLHIQYLSSATHHKTHSSPPASFSLTVSDDIVGLRSAKNSSPHADDWTRKQQPAITSSRAPYFLALLSLSILLSLQSLAAKKGTERTWESRNTAS